MIGHKVQISFGAIGSDLCYPAAGAVTEKTCDCIGFQQIISVYHVVHAPGGRQAVFIISDLGIVDLRMDIHYRLRQGQLFAQGILQSAILTDFHKIFFDALIRGPCFIHVRDHENILEITGITGYKILGLSDPVHIQFFFRQIVACAGPGTEKTDFFNRQVLCQRFDKITETGQVCIFCCIYSAVKFTLLPESQRIHKPVVAGILLRRGHLSDSLQGGEDCLIQISGRNPLTDIGAADRRIDGPDFGTGQLIELPGKSGVGTGFSLTLFCHGVQQVRKFRRDQGTAGSQRFRHKGKRIRTFL